MLRRKGFLAGCFVLALFIFVFPGRGQAESFEEGAGHFIKSLANRAISTLTVQGISMEERRERFRVFLKNDFAVKAIGQWVLGRYWRQANKEQQREYLSLFENLLVVTYADRFADYKGEQLEVIKTLVKGKDAVVFSEIKGPENAEPLRVEWRVRGKGDKFKIIDVMVTGISMGQTQRSEFSSVIRKNGGDIGRFIAELRSQKKIGQAAEGNAKKAQTE